MEWLNDFLSGKYSTRQYWVGRKAQKSDEEIMRSPVYAKLLGQLEESRRILEQRETELKKMELDYKMFDAAAATKLKERDSKISGLEGTLSGVRKELDEEKKKFDELERLYREVKSETRDVQRLTRENKRLRRKYLSKGALLGSLINEMDERVEEIRLSERTERLKGIERIAQGYESIMQSFSYESGMILKLNEKFLGSDKAAMVLLNSYFEPIYATSGFYKTFDLSVASDLGKVPLMDEIAKQAKAGNRQPFCISVKDSQKEGRFDVEILYARGNFGIPLGSFVFYTPHPGWFSKLSHLHFGKDTLKKFVKENLVNPLENPPQDSGIAPA